MISKTVRIMPHLSTLDIYGVVFPHHWIEETIQRELWFLNVDIITIQIKAYMYIYYIYNNIYIYLIYVIVCLKVSTPNQLNKNKMRFQDLHMTSHLLCPVVASEALRTWNLNGSRSKESRSEVSSAVCSLPQEKPTAKKWSPEELRPGAIQYNAINGFV